MFFFNAMSKVQETAHLLSLHTITVNHLPNSNHFQVHLLAKVSKFEFYFFCQWTCRSM